MRRAGGWILGVIAVVAMGGGAWIAVRPILNRETIHVAFIVTPDARPPSSDAMISGARFAVEEAGFRAGAYRIQFDASESVPTEDLFIQADGRHVLLAKIGGVWFSLFPSLEDTGSAAAGWAKSSGAQKTLVLCDRSTASSFTICKGFRDRARVDGLSFDEPIDTATDRDEILDRVLAAKPDLVFYSGEAAPYSTTFDIFNALRKRGYTGRLAMADADTEVSFLAVSNRVVEGTLLISSIGPPPQEFATRYEPATKRRAGPHAWPACFTMKAMLGVIDQAGSERTKDLERALTKNLPVNRPCALYEYRAGKFEFIRDLEK